jgi:bifunctional ADP-heptose synthase (sugar kinase/adenylyltransferase)
MMIATQFENREVFAGGVFAAANHIASFCKEIEVITSLGNLDSHEELIRKNLKPNVRLTPLHRDGVPTTRKSRFIESGYMRKVFEVYFMDDSPLDAPMETALNTLIEERAGDFDVVIATDFGHGLIGPSTTRTLVDTARFLAVNTQTNSANAGFNLVTKYPKADYVCIDAPEARLATRERTKDIDTVISELLPGIIECSRLTVTHGTNGCVTFETGQGVTKIPAFTKTVVDTVGAGDAFLAVTAPIVAAGGSMDLVGFIGNAAGAIKVSILGHRQSVEKPRLVKFLTTLLK